MSTLQQQRLIVDQLRRESSIKRIKVSQALDDIKKFISERQRDDCLIYGFHPPKTNPFSEKPRCTLI